MANMKSRTSREIATYLTLASLTIFSVMPGRLLAGPVGEQVEAGSANFTRNGNQTVIDVSTQNAIINYHSFNIGSQEYVRFNQLNAASRVLNRINGGSPTHIDGHLSANGQVYFVNPAGVMFGQGAIVDVAGIYAAAGHMNSADFLNGVDRFTNLTGDVSNFGTINAQFVALVGKRVLNDGIIFAPGGVVTMVAGDEVVIGEKNSNIMVKVTGGDADATDAAVVNTGSIDTGATGEVALGAGDMYWLGVKQEESGSVTGGDVIVEAEGSSVEITGTVDSTNSTSVLADEIAFYTVGIGAGDVTLTGNVVTVGNIAGVGGVAVLGTPRDDLHTLDFNYGTALPDGGLTFSAGSQENPKPLGDSLIVKGGSFDTVGITYTDSTPDGFNGELTYDGYAVGFAGFEPLTNTGNAADIIFTLPAGGNPDAILSDDGGAGDGNSQIDGSTFELTSFANPTNSLTINLGDGGDTITLNALDSTFNVDLTIAGGAGADSIIVNAITGAGTYNFGGGGSNDSLTGPSGAAFAFSGAATGTVDGDSFTSIETVVSGGGATTFTYNAGVTNFGTITGDGDDVVNLGDGDDAVAMSGANAGSINTTDTFSAIGTINGDAQAGADTITGTSGAAFAFTGAGAGTVDSVTFGGFETAISGGGATTFTYNAGVANFGTITGDGDDTVNLGDGVDAVVMSGANAGTINGDTFTAIGTLAGDAGTDTITGTSGAAFAFTGAGAGTVDSVTFSSIETAISGGGATTFTYNAGVANFGTITGDGDDVVNLGDGVDAVVMSGANAGSINTTDTFTAIGTLNGDAGADTITGTSGAAFAFTGAGAGTVDSVTFSSIETAISGGGATTFTYNAGVTNYGTITGDGDDVVNLGDGDDVVVLSGTNAGSINTTDTFTAIGTLNGDAGTDSLTGDDANRTWTITGADAGNLTGGVAFNNFANVTGGSQDDDFTVNFGASVSGTLSGGAGGTDTVLFNGDGAGNTIDVNSAVGDTIDVDGNSTLIANIDAVTIDALGGDDAITVAPSADYTVAVDGGAEAAADTFDLDTTPLSDSPTLTPTADGQATFTFPDDPAFQDVDYTDIETLTMSGPFPTFDMAILLATFGDDLTIQMDAGGTLLELNGSTISQSFTATLFESLTITGNGNDNTLTINETAGGLPTFGGDATGSHTNGAYIAAGTNPGNVGIHFDGAGETTTDALVLNFITGQTVSYFSDDDATANSGVINVDTAFSMSFEDLEPITMTGSGGTLNIDTTSNALADDFVLENGTGIGYNLFRENPDDGGFESVEFGGFDLVDITVGNGSANSVGIGTPTSLDTAAVNTVSLTQIDVTGGAEVTTVNVEQLPNTMQLNLDGGSGDDVFNITPAGQTLSAIAGAITIDGGIGSDTLNIDDTATAGDTTGVIDDATITGFGMTSGITNYTSIAAINFDAADAGGQTDSITINGAVVGTLTLDLGDGDDDVTVNLDNFGSTGQTLSLYGNAGDDSVIVNDTSGNDTFVIQATGANAEIDRNANTQSIVYDRGADTEDSFEHLTLNGNTGNDSITINNAGGFGLTQVSTDVTLVSTNDVITDSNDAGGVTDVTATNVTLTAADGIFGAAADNTFETNVDTLTATNTTANNIVIAEVDGLTALDIDSQAGDVTLTTNGAVTDTDANTDIAGTTVTVTNGTGAFGALANPIETAATNLAITNTSGDVFVTEVDSTTSLDIDAGTNDVVFTAQSGTLDQAGADGITASDLQLLGTGTYALDGTTNDVDNISANVTGGVTYVDTDDLTVSNLNAVTGITTTGATSLTSVGLTVDDNIDAVGVTLDATTGTLTVNTGDTVDANAGALSFTGEEIDLTDADSIMGTGSALLRPTDAADGIRIGDAADGANANILDLSDPELAALAEGFTGITIGRADGAHTINVDSVSFDDSITIQTPAGGSITVANTAGATPGITTRNSADAANITLLGDGDGGTNNVVFDINDDLLTEDGTIHIDLDGAEQGLTKFGPDGGTVTVNSVGAGTGADITIEGGLSGTGATPSAWETLVATAGTGAVSATGPMNPNTEGNWEFALVPIFSGATVSIPAGNYYGNPVFTADTLLFPAGANSIIANPTAGLAAGTPDLNFVLQPQTVGLNIGIENNDDPAGLIITQANIDAFDGTTNGGFSSITIGRFDGTGTMRINQTGGGDFSGNPAVVFDDPVFFRMAGTGGDIVVIDSQNGATANIGGIDFLTNATLSNTETAAQFATKVAGGNTLIRDNDGETAGTTSSFADGTRLDGAINFRASNTTTSIAGRIDTDGTPITYLSAVELTGITELITTGTFGANQAQFAGANIRFGTANATLDGTTPGVEDLLMLAGTSGDILFEAVVGGNVKLGDVLIPDDDNGTTMSGNPATVAVNDVTATFNFTSASFRQEEGDGNTQFAANLTTAGNNLGAFGGLGDGGEVFIRTTGNASISGTTSTQGGTAAAGNVGNPGGDVDILAANITVGPINTSGSGAATGAGGDAGDITLDAGDYTADGGGTNAGGQITLGTGAGGNITATGGSGAGGDAGDGGNVVIGQDHVAAGDDTTQTEDAIVLNTGLITINTTTGAGAANVDGNLTFDGVLTGGGNSLTANLGDSGDLLTEDLNDNITGIGTWTISNAENVTFNGDTAWSGTTFIQTTGGGTGAGANGATIFNGAVTAGAGGIDITTERVVFGDNQVGSAGGLIADPVGTADTVTVNGAGDVTIAIDESDTANVNTTNTLVINANAPFVLNGGGAFTQQGAGTNLSVVQIAAIGDPTGGNDPAITTQGGAITFRDHVQATDSANNATDSIAFTTGDAVGGNILFDQNLFAATDNTEAVFLTAGSGDISVNGKVGTTPGGADGDAALSQLLIDDIGDDDAGGAADVTFADTVYVRDFTQETGTGQTEFQGDVVVEQDFTNADVIDSTAIDQSSTAFFVRTSGNLFFNASDLAVLEVTGGVGGGNVVMQVGNADFSGGNNTIGIQSAGGTNVGVLAIEPFAAGGDLSAGTGAGGIALSNNDVNALADGGVTISGVAGNDYGFSRIFLGRSDGTGSISLNNGVTFHAPLYVRAPQDAGAPNIGNITIGGSGGVVIADSATPTFTDTTGAEIVFDAHQINLGGTVTTNAGDVYFVSGGSADNTGDFIPDPTAWYGDDVNGVSALDGLGDVTLVGSSTVDSTGGDIIFENDIDGDGNPGDFNLTLDAGGAADGDIAVGSFDAGAGSAVTGRVGGTDRIGAILITDAANVTFGGDGAGADPSTSTAGTGSIDATSFTQTAGSGDTNLFGTTDILGDGVFTALRTGAYDDEDGGNVSIDTTGAFFTAGAIVSRGGDTTAAGDGNDAGFVDIAADTVEVQRIDATGSDAVTSGDGGAGNTITLDAIGGGTDTIIVHGDLLANAGTGAGGGQAGNAADVQLGDTDGTFDDLITIAPDDANTGAHNTTADTVLITGNDVDFYGPVNADLTDANGDSLTVNSFDNFSQTPIFGITTFHADLGTGVDQAIGGGDDAPIDTLLTDANLAAGSDGNGYTTTANIADEILVTNNAVFNDTFVVGTAIGTNTGDTIIQSTAGDVTFNSYIESLDNGVAGSDHGLTVLTLAVGGDTTIAKSVGTDIAAIDSDDPADADGDGDTHGLEFLVTDDTAGFGDDQGQLFLGGFGDITIELFGGPATSATFNDQVVLDDSVTINSAGANGITFADLVDSIGAEANDLTVNTTGGETTTFTGAVGSGDISDLTGGVATNALGLGNLSTDMTAAAGVNANGNGTTVLQGLQADGVSDGLIRTSADQTYNDPILINESVTTNLVIEGVNVSFLSTVDEGATDSQDLTVNATGTTQFGDEAPAGTDAVGGATPLASLTTDSVAVSGTTVSYANITTDGGTQTYNDPFIVAGDITLTDTGTTGIFFNNRVDDMTAGTNTLNVVTTNAGAVIQFGDGTGDDRVGNAAALGELNVTVNDTAVVPGLDGVIIVRASDGAGNASVTTSNAGGGSGDQTWTGPVEVSATSSSPGSAFPTTNGGTTTFTGVNLTFTETTAGTSRIDALDIDGKVANSEPQTLDEALVFNASGILSIVGPIGSLNDTDGTIDDEWISDVTFIFADKFVLQNDVTIDGNIVFNGLGTGRIAMADFVDGTITLDTNSDDLGASGDVIMSGVVGVSAHDDVGPDLPGAVLRQNLVISTLSGDAAGGDVVLAGFDNVENGGGYGNFYVNSIAVDTSGSDTTAITGNSGTTTLTDDIELDDNALAGGAVGGLTITGNGNIVSALDAVVNTAGVVTGTGAGVDTTTVGTLTIDTENTALGAVDGGPVNFNNSNLFADGTVGAHDFAINTASDGNAGGAVDLGLVNDGNGAGAFLNDFSIDTQGTGDTTSTTTLDRDIFLAGSGGDNASFIVDSAIGVDTTSDTAEDGTAGDGIITVDTDDATAGNGNGGLVDLGGNTGGAFTSATIGGLNEGDADLTIDASAATTGGTVYLGAFGAGPGGLYINDLRVTTNGATDGTTFTMFDIQVDDNNGVPLQQADQASVTIDESTFVLLDDGVDQTINIDTEFDGDASGATAPGAADRAGAAGYVDLRSSETVGDVVGLTLNLDTSATNGVGGAVDLGLFSDASGAQNFVHVLTVDADSGDSPAGDMTLHDDILLDDDGAGTPALFSYSGIGAADFGIVAISEQTGRVTDGSALLIRTEQGDDEDGGAVNFGNASITGAAAGESLLIDTHSDDTNGSGGAVAFGDVDAETYVGAANGAVATAGVRLHRFEVDTTQEITGAGTTGVTTVDDGDSDADATRIFTSPSGGPGTSGVVMRTDLQIADDLHIDTNGGVGASGLVDLGEFDTDAVAGVDFITTVSATATDLDVLIDTRTTARAVASGAVDLGLFDNDGGSFVDDLVVATGGVCTPAVTTLHDDIFLDDVAGGGGDPNPWDAFGGSFPGGESAGGDFDLIGDGDLVVSPGPFDALLVIDTNADIKDTGPFVGVGRGTDEGGSVTVNSSVISSDAVDQSLRIFTGSSAGAGVGGTVQLFTVTNDGRSFISNLLVDTVDTTGGAADGLITLTGGTFRTRDGLALPGGTGVAGGDQLWRGPIELALTGGGTTTFTGNDVWFGQSSSTDGGFPAAGNLAIGAVDAVDVDNTTIDEAAAAGVQNLLVVTEDDAAGAAGTTLFGGQVGSTRPLDRVTTDGSVPASNGITYIGADITTIGGTQSYYDPVKLLLVDAAAITTETINLADTGSTGITFYDTLNTADDPDPTGPINLDVNLNLTVTDPGPGAQGDITFMDVVGGSGMRRLGRVQIIDSNDVLAMDTFTAKALVQQAGTGNTEFFDTVSTNGAGDAIQDATDDDVTANTFDTDPEFGIDAVGDAGDIIILTEGGIAFYNGATLNGTGAGAAGDFLVQPDVTGGAIVSPALGLSSGVLVPDDIVILGGMFSATGTGGDGDFYLSPMGRTGGKSVLATIRGASSTLFADDPATATSNVSLDGASVFVGEGEIITVFGDLTMTASDGVGASPTDNAKFVPGFGLDVPGVGFVGSVENPDGSPIVHNDLAALENITINSLEIRYRRRAIGKTVQAFGPITETDLGLDIIAGENIFYQVIPQPVTGTVGPEPIFANPGADFDVNNKLASFVGTNFDPVNEFQLRHNGPYPFGGLGFGFGPFAALDPSSNGPSNANSAEALAAVIPTPEQSGVVERETIVGDFQRELLAEFAGVDLEGLSPAQRLEFLTGRELYNDLPGVSPVKVAVARALLTENRLLYDPVANMLTFYRDFFLESVVNPETGQTELISRHIEHRRALASALDAFQQQNAEFTAESFAAFLIESPNHGEAYRAIQGMKTLKAKFTLIGLTPLENSEAMLAVAERITPEGMTTEQLMAVVRAMPAADVAVEEPDMPEADEVGMDENGETAEE